MLRHGASHGLAYLCCTILAGLVVHLVARFVPQALAWMSGWTGDVRSILRLSFLSQEQVTIIILAMLLAVIWGMVFKRLHD